MLRLRLPTVPRVSKAEIDGFKVIVTCKRIKHCYIKIDPENGDVCVSAPVRTSENTVRELVRSKAEWIKKRQAALAVSCQHQQFTFEDGELHKVWGNEVPLVNTSEFGKRGVNRLKNTLVLMPP